jgi:hypothetical protein
LCVSKWNKTTIKTICLKYGVNFSFSFILRAEIRKRPFIILTITFILSVFLLGFSLMSFEYAIINTSLEQQKSKNELNSLSNSFWLIIVTMTTVGYGDYYPRSHLGRFIGVICCIFGSLLVSMTVVSLGNFTVLNEKENKAFLRIMKLKENDRIEGNAAYIVSYLLTINKFCQAKRCYLNSLSLLLHNKRFMKRFVDDVRMSQFRHVDTTDYCKAAETNIRNDINNLSKCLRKMSFIVYDIKELKVGQENQLCRIDKVLDMKSTILKYLETLNDERYVERLSFKKYNSSEDIDMKRKKRSRGETIVNY